MSPRPMWLGNHAVAPRGRQSLGFVIGIPPVVLEAASHWQIVRGNPRSRSLRSSFMNRATRKNQFSPRRTELRAEGKRLLDSANFAAEFKALAERDIPDTSPSLYGHDRLNFCGYCTEGGIGDWHPSGGPSELFLAEFTDVATRAGFVLNAPTGVNPCDYFLDCLYNELIERRSSYALEVPGPEFGRLYRVCDAAATFWLWHKATTNAKKHGFVKFPDITASNADPDVHVRLGPSSSGGIVLFRNKGSEAANNVRLQCSPEIGWQPTLSPEVVPSLPAGGHFRASDISKYGTEDEDGWATNNGQSIAEFVDSLPTKALTMTVTFRDQLGNDRSRDFRLSIVEWAGYIKLRARMEEATISTPTPKPEGVESAAATTELPTKLAHGPEPSGGDYFSERRNTVPPRSVPNLQISRERLDFVATLARELAVVKQETKTYCTVDALKQKYPRFTLWTVIEDSQIKELVDGEAFTPKAYAENLTLTKYGLTSRETLKKDRLKLRKAGKAGAP